MLSKALTNFRLTRQLPKFVQQRAAAYATEPAPEPIKKPNIPWKDSRILVAGCQGQIGVPLVRALCEELGSDNVVATDVSD